MPRVPKAIAPAPPLREMRKLLKKNYDNVAIEELCMDYFEAVYGQFSEGMRLDKKIHLLIKHCHKQ